jgi:hypothetical protein
LSLELTRHFFHSSHGERLIGVPGAALFFLHSLDMVISYINNGESLEISHNRRHIRSFFTLLHAYAAHKQHRRTFAFARSWYGWRNIRKINCRSVIPLPREKVAQQRPT